MEITNTHSLQTDRAGRFQFAILVEHAGRDSWYAHTIIANKAGQIVDSFIEWGDTQTKAVDRAENRARTDWEAE